MITNLLGLFLRILINLNPYQTALLESLKQWNPHPSELYINTLQ